MRPIQSWYIRRLKLFLPIYVGLIFIVAHFYGWRIVDNRKPSDGSEGYLPNHSNYAKIVGDDDQSLPFDFQAGKFNFSRLTTLNETSSNFKVIAAESNEFGADNLDGCPDWRCKIVQLNVADDVVSMSVDAIVVKGFDPSPWKRRPDQYVVFFSQESPANWLSDTKEPSMFNLTMGYRRDADVPCPYGYFVKRPQAVPFSTFRSSQLRNLVENKKKVAAWFVSNCYVSSGRSELVAELKKYMPVDVFGACGDKSCPRSEYSSNDSLMDDPCNRMLVDDYKFYFAFENSICKDYTTEKFWEKINLYVVVVVLSRRILEKYAPSDAFIAADDFNSAADLARYLMKLHNNDDLYMNYFKWRTGYEAIFLNGRQHDVRERPWGFCRLCKILWTRPTVKKVYSGQLSDNYWSLKQCYGTVQKLMAGR